MNTATIFGTVKLAVEAGISVWPPMQDGSKRPMGKTWKAKQKIPATINELRKVYKNETVTGIGIIPGAVSGNLECLDFDERGIYDVFRQVAIESGLGPLLERLEAGYLERAPNGNHSFYKCSEISGSTKLATRPKRPEEMKDKNDKIKTLIETRGEGGYIIVAPTHGSVNPDGNYDLVSGNFSTIATITPDERQDLFNLARTFHIEPEGTAQKQYSNDIKAGGRPGDDFNKKAGWPDILSPHGWTSVYSRGDVEYWQRPGKIAGISATTNHNDMDLFHNFSSSTPFDTNKSYTKFHAYAVLNHGGDFKAAAKELAGKGYGEQKAEVTKQAATKMSSFIKNATELISNTDDTEWIIYPVIPRGAVSILAGAMKDGKTWFAIELGAAVSFGRDVCGIYPCQPSKVLLIEGDMPDQLMKWRLQNAGYIYDPERFTTLSKFNLLKAGIHLDLSNAAGVSALDDVITEAQPALVIIDSLSAFHSVEEKDATSMKPIITDLSELANKHNIHIMLVHHTRKRAKNEEKLDLSLNEVIGTNVILRFASIIYGVQKAKDPATGETLHTVTTLGSWFKPIDPVVFTIKELDEKLRIEFTSVEQLPRFKTDYVIFMIEKLLKEGPKKRVELIRDLQGVSSPTIDRALAKLCESGRIERKGLAHSPNTVYTPIYPSKSDKPTPQTLMGVSIESLSQSLSLLDPMINPTVSPRESLSSSRGHDKPYDKPKTVEAVSVEGRVYQKLGGMRDEETADEDVEYIETDLPGASS